MNNPELKAAVDRFTAAVINRTTLGYGTVAVQETITLTPGSQQPYALATLLAGNANTMDYKAAMITVKALDEDPASPTYNLYIDADAAVSAGVSGAGNVVLHNRSLLTLTCYVRIDVPYVHN